VSVRTLLSRQLKKWLMCLWKCFCHNCCKKAWLNVSVGTLLSQQLDKMIGLIVSVGTLLSQQLEKGLMCLWEHFCHYS
jgi:hypothetical protein